MNYKNNMRNRTMQQNMQNMPRGRFPGVVCDDGCIRLPEQPMPRMQCDTCGKVNVPDGYVSLAMVYPVSQCWRMITDGCAGLDRGTIFDELDKPFMGDKCKRGGMCR